MQVHQENPDIILSHEEYGSGQALVALVGSACVIQSSFEDAISAIGIGSVGTAAIALALRECKKVRKLILIDTSVRPQSSLPGDKCSLQTAYSSQMPNMF